MAILPLYRKWTLKFSSWNINGVRAWLKVSLIRMYPQNQNLILANGIYQSFGLWLQDLLSRLLIIITLINNAYTSLITIYREVN